MPENPPLLILRHVGLILASFLATAFILLLISKAHPFYHPHKAGDLLEKSFRGQIVVYYHADVPELRRADIAASVSGTNSIHLEPDVIVLSFTPALTLDEAVTDI